MTLTNQIGIEVDPAQSPVYSRSGDSGSVVVNDECKVIGLHFAGGDEGRYGVANPIQAVLDTLDVRMCTGQTGKGCCIVRGIKYIFQRR